MEETEKELGACSLGIAKYVQNIEGNVARAEELNYVISPLRLHDLDKRDGANRN